VTEWPRGDQHLRSEEDECEHHSEGEGGGYGRQRGENNPQAHSRLVEVTVTKKQNKTQNHEGCLWTVVTSLPAIGNPVWETLLVTVQGWMEAKELIISWPWGEAAGNLRSTAARA
jgi:hypothetical protein